MNVRILSAAMLASVFLCACPQMPKIVRLSDPLTVDEHVILGSIYEREGNYGRALDEYSAALKQDPENFQALTGIGNISFHAGNYRLAIRYYQRALKIDPDNAVILNNLAMAYLMTGKPKKALECADRALAQSANRDPRLLDTRAQARLAAGDQAGAIQDLDEAVEKCCELCPAEGLDPEVCDPNLEASCAEIAARRNSIP